MARQQPGDKDMQAFKKFKLAFIGALCISSAVTMAADIKIGIVAPLSGPFAYLGQQIKTSAEAYVASQGGNGSKPDRY
jgi:ABC-type branched-subunit amino acid transport system substrate-binding protein